MGLRETRSFGQGDLGEVESSRDPRVGRIGNWGIERLRQHADCARGQLGDRQPATDADAGRGPI